MSTKVTDTGRVATMLGGRVVLRSLVCSYQRNVRAYSEAYPTLLGEHRHEWVAFVNGKCRAVASTRAALLKTIGGLDKVPPGTLIRYIEELGKAHFH